MLNIKQVLSKKKFVISDSKVNPKWEEAKEFLEYLGLESDRSMILFILKLCKTYGAGKVYGLRSDLKDAIYDTGRIKGLMIWKLKNADNLKNEPVLPLDK